IDEDDLELAVNKYRDRAPQSQNLSLDFEQIRRMLINPAEKTYKQRFTIKMGQHLKMVNVADAECFYSENKGTYIHTGDNRDYLLECSLEQLESELDPKEFFRVSRKFIVSIKSIRDIVVYTNSRLKVVLPTYKEDEVI